jgi:predicted glutamine amidotransferase
VVSLRIAFFTPSKFRSFAGVPDLGLASIRNNAPHPLPPADPLPPSKEPTNPPCVESTGATQRLIGNQQMCRWIAYRGRTTALEDYVTEPEHSLAAQSLAALESTTSTNGDGFGLGWYGEHPEPGLYHETRPAWSDENLRYLCRHLHSHLFFAHVRAATGTAVTRQNCHPFASGRWLFMHNGLVGSWNRLRRSVEGLIPDALYPSRRGTTDSEAVFLAMMGAEVDTDPVGGTENIVGRLCDLVNDGGHRERIRFTSALTNGEDLYAFRFAENDSANSLYYKEAAGEVVVVSEPLDNASAWMQVPSNHVLIARSNADVEIREFCPRRR